MMQTLALCVLAMLAQVTALMQAYLSITASPARSPWPDAILAVFLQCAAIALLVLASRTGQ